MRIYRLELGEDHPDTQTALNLVATLHADLGDQVEAAAALERSIESTMRVLGPDHPRLAGKQTNLAIVYGRLGRLEEARRLFEDTLRIYREKLGDAAVTLSAAANLAWIRGLQGELDSAEEGFRVAVEGLTRLDATIELRTALVDWAELLRKNGREAEAVELERRIAALDER